MPTSFNNSPIGFNSSLVTNVAGGQFPVYRASYILGITSNATGSQFQPLSSFIGGETVPNYFDGVQIENYTGIDIEVLKINSDGTNSGIYIKVKDGTTRIFSGLYQNSLSNISFRRVDESNVQVTIQAEAYQV